MRDFSWKVIRADQQMPRKTREFVSECQLTPKDQDRFQRAEAANDNGFVSLPFFAAAIVAGNLAKLPNKTLNNVAALYIGSRIAFNMLYIFGTTSESGHFLPSFPLGNVVANRRRLRHRALGRLARGHGRLPVALRPGRQDVPEGHLLSVPTPFCTCTCKCTHKHNIISTSSKNSTRRSVRCIPMTSEFPASRVATFSNRSETETCSVLWRPASARLGYVRLGAAERVRGLCGAASSSA